MLNELWEVCYFLFFIFFGLAVREIHSYENCCVGRLRQLCEVIFRECKRERGAD